MVEYIADGLVIAFAIATSHENLCPDAESQCNHEYDQIVYSGNCRCAQLHFSDTTHEGSIGQSDKLFHQHTDEDRVGNQPYFFIRVFFHLLKSHKFHDSNEQQ